MSYLDTFNASKDSAFQGRCLVACWSTATDILAENPLTPNHNNRKAWAANILRGQQQISNEQLAVQVLRNSVIAAAPALAADADLKFAVTTFLNDLIEIG